MYEAAPDEKQSATGKRKYEELSIRNTMHESLLDAIRSKSEIEASAIVHRIRRGEDVADIVRHVEYGDLLLQSALVPETRYRYEFPVLAALPQRLKQSANPF